MRTRLTVSDLLQGAPFSSIVRYLYRYPQWRMDRSIAQALNGLIPTFNGPLPSELVELAASLLAQSRSKASSLKAEEEIARSYACANLACERCETRLP